MDFEWKPRAMSVTKIPPITMSKLYVGNLPMEANEGSLRQLFADQNLSCTNILIKRGGYAFVDCPDQSSADKAIDKLNGKSSVVLFLSRLAYLTSMFSGFNFHGSLLIVEPSVASGKRR